MPADRVAITEERVRRMFQRLNAGPIWNLGGGLVYDPATDTLTIGLLTAKGDLFGRSATDNARVPVGPDGTVLGADSADAEGLSYVRRAVVLSRNLAYSTTINNPGVGIETNFSLNYTLPANSFEEGTTLRVEADFSSLGSALNTDRVKFKTGATALWTTGFSAHAGAVTTQRRIILEAICRVAGATGTLDIHTMQNRSPQTGGDTGLLVTTNNPFDTTASHTFQFSIEWSLAAASAETQTLFLIQRLN